MMRIRLVGTDEEVTAVAELLGEVLAVREVSRPYPNRPPSQLCRVYLDVDPPAGLVSPRRAGSGRLSELDTRGGVDDAT